MNELQSVGSNTELPPSKARQRWKLAADLLPLIGFFGVFFLFGRDMIVATTGLLVGLLAQLTIYKLIHQLIPRWMKLLTVIALVFAAMTLLFRDPDFIKIRSSVTGFLVGCFLLGSVLIRKNILEIMLGELIIFPHHTWNVITVLWSLPIFANAGLNLVIGNQLPWFNWQFSDDVWMSYRFFGGFIVTALSFGVVLFYLFVTKQKPIFRDVGNTEGQQ